MKERIFLVLLLVGVFFLSSCSKYQLHRSGRYVLIGQGESVESLAKSYGVSVESLKQVNKRSQWSAGEWIFIPSQQGILAYVYGDASLYGWGFLAPEDFSGGELLWPTPSSFRITSIHGEDRKTHDHGGIDIAAPMGDEILAVQDGTISFSGSDPKGYGEFLMINHGGGMVTIYGHLLKKKVKYGEKVERGQVIALVGNSGRSSGPHLHFEVKLEGKSVDPIPYLRR